MASPFAQLITDVVPIPHDSPNTVTIQKLSGRAIERAQEVAAEKAVNGRGFADKVSRALVAAKEGDGAKLDAVIADPLNGYDRHAVLINGITGWTYEQKCDPESIAQLDDETAELLARAIMRLTKPHLFEAPEVVQKKG